MNSRPAPPETAAADFRATARALVRHCAAYKGADTRRSLLQLANTFIPLAAILAVMGFGYAAGFWPVLLLVIPAGGLLVRVFIIQHDCGHGSFFRSRRANDILGHLLSVLTLAPYMIWRRAHAVHHATSGNLDRRGTGDILTLTVQEYRAMPAYKRLAYRIFRNPVMVLGFGAPWLFLINYRVPFGAPLPFRDAWRGILVLDLVLVAVYGLAVALVGWQALTLLVLPSVLIAAWAGGWLFFIQHQFADSHWAREGEWDFHTSAILGSSYLVLPRVLQWFSGNIGLHHIHHLCGKIPNYRLQECLDASPVLQTTSRLTLRDSLGCLRLALWDETDRRMIGFREAARIA